MGRPKLLDLFSGAGGTGMGYYRAGFDVFGVDNDPKPLRHYPFPHACGDALNALADLINGEGLVFSGGHTLFLEDFDAIHASPPCQFYSRLRHLPWLRNRVYWRSVPPTRAVLMSTGKAWVMENVEDCFDMPDSIILCGQMFQRRIFRHRRFETWPFLLLQPPHERHRFVITPGSASLSKRHHGLNAWNGEADHQSGADRHRANLGVNWMTGAELSQAIPPVYTEYIGTHLLRAIAQRQHPDTAEEKHD